MKGILALLIIGFLVYLGYVMFDSSATQQSMQSERIEQEGLRDLEGDLVLGTPEAVVEVNTEIKGFLEKIRNAIERARLAIRGKSSTSIEIQ